MESKSAARYAKSLLDLAEETNSVEAVYEDLSSLKAIMRQNRELVAVLNSPIISGQKKGQILNKLFNGKVHKLTTAFFDLLNRKHREGQLATIVDKFIEQYNLKKGFSQATVTTAVPLTEALKAQVQSFVERHSSNKVQLIEKIDPSIIGGIKIQIGDRLLDYTVASQLKTLENSLIDKSFIKKL